MSEKNYVEQILVEKSRELLGDIDFYNTKIAEYQNLIEQHRKNLTRTCERVNRISEQLHIIREANEIE
jgi:hypothetical protein